MILGNQTKIFTLVLVTVILTVSLFGFAYINHDGNCFLSLGDSSNCPPLSLGMVIHHIASYNSFFSVVTVSTVSLLILFLLFLFVGYIFSLTRRIETNRLDKLYLLTNKDTFYSPQIIAWLSLFENSPAN